jgi:hypothetical protein
MSKLTNVTCFTWNSPHIQLILNRPLRMASVFVCLVAVTIIEKSNYLINVQFPADISRYVHIT